MTKIGYIVMTGYEYEGLSGMHEPYRVYWDKAKAEEAAVKLNTSGTYGEVIAVEVEVGE